MGYLDAAVFPGAFLAFAGGLRAGGAFDGGFLADDVLVFLCGVAFDRRLLAGSCAGAAADFAPVDRPVAPSSPYNRR